MGAPSMLIRLDGQPPFLDAATSACDRLVDRLATAAGHAAGTPASGWNPR